MNQISTQSTINLTNGQRKVSYTNGVNITVGTGSIGRTVNLVPGVLTALDTGSVALPIRLMILSNEGPGDVLITNNGLRHAVIKYGDPVNIISWNGTASLYASASFVSGSTVTGSLNYDLISSV